MESFKFLNYSVADALATITINRPPHNVLDIALMEELNRALDIAAQEESAKLLMITAAGEKVFSAGVDVMDHTPDKVCLLYTSPSPRDRTRSRMPSSA